MSTRNWTPKFLANPIFPQLNKKTKTIFPFCFGGIWRKDGSQKYCFQKRSFDTYPSFNQLSATFAVFRIPEICYSYIECIDFQFKRMCTHIPHNHTKGSWIPYQNALEFPIRVDLPERRRNPTFLLGSISSRSCNILASIHQVFLNEFQFQVDKSKFS